MSYAAEKYDPKLFHSGTLMRPMFRKEFANVLILGNVAVYLTCALLNARLTTNKVTAFIAETAEMRIPSLGPNVRVQYFLTHSNCEESVSS